VVTSSKCLQTEISSECCDYGDGSSDGIDGIDGDGAGDHMQQMQRSNDATGICDCLEIQGTFSRAKKCTPPHDRSSRLIIYSADPV